MATADTGGARARRGPLLPARRSGPQPCACLGRPSGTWGGTPAAHKAGRNRGGPPVQRLAKPSTSGPPIPPLRRAPSSAWPHTTQTRISTPILGNRLTPYPRWEQTSPPPPPPAVGPWSLFVAPTPADRCVRGTSSESTGVCSPIPPGSSWRVLGFHSLRLPQPGQHRRPLPVRVLFSGYGGTMGRGGGQESWAGLPRGPSLVWPGLSAVTTMGSL